MTGRDDAGARMEAALVVLPPRVLVAVSGGVDSMALLHALTATGRDLVVLHFDHRWRSESADEAKGVEREAQRLGLKFVAGKMRARPKTKREAEARAARYAFFAQMARRLKIADLVLAHHADDQVETFLLQLLRGTGAAGRGMAAVSTRAGLILHRPWLGIWKKEILAYARQHQLTWREDASNADLRHRRNLVRGRLMPYLRRNFGPGVEANLWRAAEIARAESDWLDALCAAEAAHPRLAVQVIAEMPVAQQRRVILRWLQGRDEGDIGFADVEAVRGLLTQRDPAKINLSGGRHARRRAGTIFLE